MRAGIANVDSYQDAKSKVLGHIRHSVVRSRNGGRGGAGRSGNAADATLPLISTSLRIITDHWNKSHKKEIEEEAFIVRYLR